jgi:hypothetical protein
MVRPSRHQCWKYMSHQTCWVWLRATIAFAGQCIHQLSSLSQPMHVPVISPQSTIACVICVASADQCMCQLPTLGQPLHMSAIYARLTNAYAGTRPQLSNGYAVCIASANQWICSLHSLSQPTHVAVIYPQPTIACVVWAPSADQHMCQLSIIG